MLVNHVATASRPNTLGFLGAAKVKPKQLAKELGVSKQDVKAAMKDLGVKKLTVHDAAAVKATHLPHVIQAYTTADDVARATIVAKQQGSTPAKIMEMWAGQRALADRKAQKKQSKQLGVPAGISRDLMSVAQMVQARQQGLPDPARLPAMYSTAPVQERLDPRTGLPILTPTALPDGTGHYVPDNRARAARRVPRGSSYDVAAETKPYRYADDGYSQSPYQEFSPGGYGSLAYDSGGGYAPTPLPAPAPAPYDPWAAAGAASVAQAAPSGGGGIFDLIAGLLDAIFGGFGGGGGATAMPAAPSYGYGSGDPLLGPAFDPGLNPAFLGSWFSDALKGKGGPLAPLLGAVGSIPVIGGIASAGLNIAQGFASSSGSGGGNKKPGKKVQQIEAQQAEIERLRMQLVQPPAPPAGAPIVTAPSSAPAGGITLNPTTMLALGALAILALRK